jgi:putative transposase
MPAPSELNERWGNDFMSDELVSGRRFRVLTLIDLHNRECLALRAGFCLPAEKVTEVLDRVIRERGAPVALTLDNGTEFTSRHFDAWA